jgi:excisionase family DNA binding protein
MDAAEAAERLGMTEAALRKAAARGTVPFQRIGRRLRFRLSKLLSEVEVRGMRQGRLDSAGAVTSSTLP